MASAYPLFIKNEFLHTPESLCVINPSTAEECASVSVASVEHVEAALSAAFAAAQALPQDIPARRRLLEAIAEGIRTHAAELATLESTNTGKPIKETTFMDIPAAAQTFQYYADHLPQLLAPEERRADDTTRGVLLREPRGVVVIIVPWNYPLLIASWKIAAALAAGNAVIVKPSSLTPLSVLELARIVQEAGAAAGSFNVLVGPGERLGERLCADERVDMVSFTGSGAVGKKIMGYRGGNVKSLIMELGGKSAALVCADADVDLAVNALLCGIFLNAGQMCTAMSRILLAQEIADEFLEHFVAKAKRLHLGSGLDYQTQMGPLISRAHRDTVCSFVGHARSEGARILCGGRVPDDPRLKDGFFFEPTVLSGLTPGMGILREEVFGPVACVQTFTDAEEGLVLANDSVFALAGSVWSRDAAGARELAGRLQAGIVWINTYGMFHTLLPYGGFKRSGFGKELGREGLLEYTRLKTVVVEEPAAGNKPLVNYWYGG